MAGTMWWHLTTKGRVGMIYHNGWQTQSRNPNLWHLIVDRGIPRDETESLLNYCFIYTSRKALAQVNKSLIGIIKTESHGPSSISRLDLLYRPRTPRMKGRLGPLKKNLSTLPLIYTVNFSPRLLQGESTVFYQSN